MVGRPASAMISAVFGLALGLMPPAQGFAGGATVAALAGDGGAEKPVRADAGVTPVRVRAWPHSGFDRIVFDWPRPVEYSASMDAGRLVVRFARPLAISLGRVHKNLAPYVTTATISADRQTVSVGFGSRRILKTFTNGSSVVVDLEDRTPGTANESAAGPTPFISQRPLKVRFGDHQGFSRLVFDWSRNVGYRITKKAGIIIIRFDRPARVDVAALNTARPKYLAGISAANIGAKNGKGELVVRLTVQETARMRHFRAGTRVVVDILKPHDPATAAKAGRPVNLLGRPATTGAKAPAKATADFAMAPIGKPSKEGGKTTADEPASASSGPVREESDTFPAAAPGAGAAVAEAGPAAISPTDLVAARLKISPGAGPVTVEWASTRDVTKLRFGWRQVAAAAVFTRAGFLWVVFDRPAVFDLRGRGGKRGRGFTRFEKRFSQSTVSGATVVRIRLGAKTHPVANRNGTEWIIELRKEPPPLSEGIPLETHLAAITGPRLFFNVAGGGKALKLTDPEVGDQIWVVPVAGAGLGVGERRNFAELHILASAQGVAVKPMVDGLEVRTLPKGIELTKIGGLRLSDRRRQGAHADGVPDEPTAVGETRGGLLFDFEAWQRRKAGIFTQAKHELLRAVIKAPEGQRNAARFQLAQFFFSFGFATDVIALLQVIEADAPELTNEAAFRALRGASHYLRGRYKKAERDLFHPSLDPEREVALWRAVLAGSQGNWTTAAKYFSRSEAILKAYPRGLRIPFGLLAAEAALEVGEMGLAKVHLDALAELAPDGVHIGKVAYLRGRLHAKVSDVEGAMLAWDRAIRIGRLRVRVKASFARIELLVKEDKISHPEAIKELEKLRYAARGGDIEFDFLRWLGELYLAEGDFKNGLMTLREAATYFPKEVRAREVTREMRAAFIRLYIDGAADELPPLTALALYDEFRELTPLGDVGNELITNLAGRLVKVDLLDRAVALLKHQINTRLKGVQKTRAANQLAFVYLLDRKPDDALAVLDGKVAPDTPPEVAIQRRHLKVRALGEIADYAKAVKLLGGDFSRDADLLRAEIFWRTQEWGEAAKVFARLVPAQMNEEDKDGDNSFGDEEKRTVLNWAIALSLSGNSAGLDAVRRRFAKQMAEGPYNEAFKVVTSHTAAPITNYRMLTQKVAEVDHFQAFMASYRERLLKLRAPGVN
ncbi:MAG: hypothetical protein O6757_12455 [Alphaproteobacteria bacterium]|nr:hypothetical protein [Alphaproteobacteria bacterium]